MNLRAASRIELGPLIPLEAELGGGRAGVGGRRVGVPRERPEGLSSASSSGRPCSATTAASDGSRRPSVRRGRRRAARAIRAHRADASSAAIASAGSRSRVLAVILTAVPKPLSASSIAIRASGRSARRPSCARRAPARARVGDLDGERLALTHQPAHPRLHPDGSSASSQSSGADLTSVRLAPRLHPAGSARAATPAAGERELDREPVARDHVQVVEPKTSRTAPVPAADCRFAAAP